MTDVNSAAFAKCFLMNRSDVDRYVRRLMGSREGTEDIVQEAFLRTYRHSERVLEPRAFVYTAARNLVADSRRRNRTVSMDVLGDFDGRIFLGSSESLEDQLLASEQRRLLEEALARLPPQCRAVLMLRIREGFSYKAIARKLGLSPKTVENHVARGLREAHQYVRRRYQ